MARSIMISVIPEGNLENPSSSFSSSSSSSPWIDTQNPWQNACYIDPNAQNGPSHHKCIEVKPKESPPLSIRQNLDKAESGGCRNHENLHPRRFDASSSVLDSILACGRNKDLHRGRRMHAIVLETGLHHEDTCISNALIGMYMNCGKLEKARHVFFSEVPMESTGCLNSLIVSYAQGSRIEEALFCLRLMLDRGCAPPQVPTIACILKACGAIRSLKLGEEIDAELNRNPRLVSSNVVLGTALLDMYARCGETAKARAAFDRIKAPDVAAWNALISMYARRSDRCEEEEEEEDNDDDDDDDDDGDAIGSFGRMMEGGCLPDAVTLVGMLKACAKRGHLRRGKEIHVQSLMLMMSKMKMKIQKMMMIQEKSISSNVVMGTALIDMYAKCGEIARAQEAFDELRVRNVVSWNALIAGYVHRGLGDRAVDCLARMEDEGILPSASTLASLMGACASIGSIRKGEELHSQMQKLSRLSRKDVLVLGTALIDLYARCGALGRAEQVLDELPERDLVAWNAMISAYVRQAWNEQALACFGRMQRHGIVPNEMTFASVLKAVGSAETGEEIHAEMSRRWGIELDRNCILGTALVDMYARCSRLDKAKEVVESIVSSARGAGPWNALIAGYTRHGLCDQAINCFETMLGKQEEEEEEEEEEDVGEQRDSIVSPDAVTFSSALKACGRRGLTEKGEQIHLQASQTGVLARNSIVGGALVDMYARCGELGKAQAALDSLAVRDVVSWTALVCGYSRHGLGHEALACYEQMLAEGIRPNALTFSCAIKACAIIGSIERGDEIYSRALAEPGLLEQKTNVVLGNAAVDMYAKCGDLAKARRVFDALQAWDAASWNALIGGYAQQGMGHEALRCLEQMQETGHGPDATTLACALKACGVTTSVARGRRIHSIIPSYVLQGPDPSSRLIANALLDMYAKCGELGVAEQLFDTLSGGRDLASWNSLIAGFSRLELCSEAALAHFRRMQEEGIAPDSATLSAALKACGSLGLARTGAEIHAEAGKQLTTIDASLVGSSLVSMYARCGLLSDAHRAFDSLPVRDAVSWTALISAYARLADAKHVLALFHRMIADGTSPDSVTVSIVLTVCSHASLVAEGEMCFDSIATGAYGLTPTLEHCARLVELFSRAGRFDKALAIIEGAMDSASSASASASASSASASASASASVAFSSSSSSDRRLDMWVALLGGCGRWSNLELGKWAFEQSLPLNDSHAATFVYMSNIYAAAGMRERSHLCVI